MVTLSNLPGETFLANLSFVLLFSTMIFYWIQTAFFSTKNNNAIGVVLMSLSNISLLTLLICRWKNSGHFPLSNLYESLMFLSWSLTSIHLLLISFDLKTNIRSSNIQTTLFSKYKPVELSTKEVGYQWESQSVNNLQTQTLPQGSTVLNNQWESFVENVNVESSAVLKKDNSLDIRTKSLISSWPLGAITSPCALFTNAFANFSLPDEMRHSSALVPALQSNWLVMHVTIMILSYAALIAGCLLSISFLVLTGGQESYSRVTENQSIVDPKFLIAQTLDNLSYRVLGIGFPLLTIGILSGAVWANEAWGSYWSWDPKETWALLTWLVFAVYLHTRITKGWQGKKPAIIASIGFVVVWICFLGVNLIGKGLHSYGWIQNT